MCEFALKPHPNPDQKQILLGINFFENYLQLYNMAAKELCLKSTNDPTSSIFTPVPFPYAPKILSKWTVFGWAIAGVTVLCLLIAIIIFFVAPRPGYRDSEEYESDMESEEER
jgi:hypothetical protein